MSVKQRNVIIERGVKIGSGGGGGEGQFTKQAVHCIREMNDKRNAGPMWANSSIAASSTFVHWDPCSTHH